MKRFLLLIMIFISCGIQAKEPDKLEFAVNGLILGVRDTVVRKAEPHIQMLKDYDIIRKGIKSEAEVRAAVFYGKKLEDYAKLALQCESGNCQIDAKKMASVKSVPDAILKEVLPKYLGKDGVIEAKLAAQAIASLRWMSSSKQDAPVDCSWDMYKILTSEAYKNLFIKAENCLQQRFSDSKKDRPRCDKEVQAEEEYMQKELKKLESKCGIIH